MSTLTIIISCSFLLWHEAAQQWNDSFLYFSILPFWRFQVLHFSRIQLCATPWTAAQQGPPSLGFSRQEHWSGLPFPPPMHWKWKVKVKSLSRVRLFVTPWTVAYQVPPSMGFSRQEYWRGVPLPSPKSLSTWCQRTEWRSSGVFIFLVEHSHDLFNAN